MREDHAHLASSYFDLPAAAPLPFSTSSRVHNPFPQTCSPSPGRILASPTDHFILRNRVIPFLLLLLLLLLQPLLQLLLFFSLSLSLSLSFFLPKGFVSGSRSAIDRYLEMASTYPTSRTPLLSFPSILHTPAWNRPLLTLLWGTQTISASLFLYFLLAALVIPAIKHSHRNHIPLLSFVFMCVSLSLSLSPFLYIICPSPSLNPLFFAVLVPLPTSLIRL
jgi:hypothetical protein